MSLFYMVIISNNLALFLLFSRENLWKSLTSFHCSPLWSLKGMLLFSSSRETLSWLWSWSLHIHIIAFHDILELVCLIDWIDCACSSPNPLFPIYGGTSTIMKTSWSGLNVQKLNPTFTLLRLSSEHLSNYSWLLSFCRHFKQFVTVVVLYEYQSAFVTDSIG